jgi:hypothetical protein
MRISTNYGMVDTAAEGQLADWNGYNDMADVLDNQVGHLFAALALDGWLSGWAIAAGTDLNVAAGEGRVAGAHCKTTIAQAITGITANTTNYVYATRKAAAIGRVSASFTLAMVDFVANTTGVTPANSILLASGVVNVGGTNFSSVDNAPAAKITICLFAPQVIIYTSNGTPDTQDTVAHQLGRTPTGFLVINRDKAGVVYKGASAWTSSNIYLKCNVASVAVTMLVF